MVSTPIIITTEKTIAGGIHAIDKINTGGIHNGDTIHHQDHSITTVSITPILRRNKMINSKPQNPTLLLTTT